ncbi:MAG: hypothetical protein JW900_12620 [Anaerolineae bacterium]|nr:hypothetical protein [Anaerolineae bacterium]
MAYPAWYAQAMALLHDAARCLALAQQGRLGLGPRGYLRRASLQTLAGYTCCQPAGWLASGEPAFPAHRFLLGLLQEAGQVEAAGKALRVADDVRQWLSRPAIEQIGDLRQAWFRSLSLGWRWLAADRAYRAFDRHWQAITLEAVAAVAGLPVAAWTPAAQIIADLDAHGVLALDEVAHHLPDVRRAHQQQTTGILSLLFETILPGLGLVERSGEDDGQRGAVPDLPAWRAAAGQGSGAAGLLAR